MEAVGIARLGHQGAGAREIEGGPRARTQTSLARKLGVGQEAVSRAEARGDLLLSTLRAYVAALGGELDLIVRFKDRAPVSLRGIKEKRGARKAA
ncbi:MAG: hypothetical protein NBV67_11440 [Tagaea sp.]|nr:hypothetical protein [Tagaea sp.]